MTEYKKEDVDFLNHTIRNARIGNGVPIDHGNLTGLGDQSHPDLYIVNCVR